MLQVCTENKKMRLKRRGNAKRRNGKKEGIEDNPFHKEKRIRRRGKKVKLFKVNKVIFMVARSLCVDQAFSAQIQREEIAETATFAEERMKDIFRTILSGKKIFLRDPVSRRCAARCILKQVYGIRLRDLII